MDNAEIYKSYRITYKTVTTSGTLGVEYKKEIIQAKNKETAIEMLRSASLENNNCGIRVNRIEHINPTPEPIKKSKKSVLGLVAFSLFILAMSGRLIKTLF